MGHHIELRREAQRDFCEPLRQIAKQGISSLLACENGLFRVPSGFTLPAPFTDLRPARFHHLLAILYIEAVMKAVEISPGGERTKIDEAALLQIFERQFSLSPENTAKNSRLIREVAEDGHGLAYLAALLMSAKKRTDFDHRDLYSRVFLQVLREGHKQRAGN